MAENETWTINLESFKPIYLITRKRNYKLSMHLKTGLWTNSLKLFLDNLRYFVAICMGKIPVIPQGKMSIIEQITWNKSRLLLQNILQNTQTLQLFSLIIKKVIILKSN